MNHLFAKTLCLLAAAGLYLAAVKQTQATSEAPEQNLSYSTVGRGPSILLLHDSSRSDRAWADAARELAGRFQVTLVDTTAYLGQSNGAQQLRDALQALSIDDARIAGSASAEPLALRYALSFPAQSESFVLPHDSEDLQILADLFNTKQSSKS